jgi:hypothetical protein
LVESYRKCLVQKEKGWKERLDQALLREQQWEQVYCELIACSEQELVKGEGREVRGVGKERECGWGNGRAMEGLEVEDCVQ